MAERIDITKYMDVIVCQSLMLSEPIMFDILRISNKNQSLNQSSVSLSVECCYKHCPSALNVLFVIEIHSQTEIQISHYKRLMLENAISHYMSYAICSLILIYPWPTNPVYSSMTLKTFRRF